MIELQLNIFTVVYFVKLSRRDIARHGGTHIPVNLGFTTGKAGGLQSQPRLYKQSETYVKSVAFYSSP